MAFIEALFPTAIGLNAVGGPAFSTIVNSGDSGFEQCNESWEDPLASWQIAFTIKPQLWYDQLQRFFYAVRGKSNKFRFLWHADHTATNEILGTGDDTTLIYQLKKTYSFPITEFTYTKLIQKPVTSDVVNYLGEPLEDTVVISVNGIPLEPLDWNLDHTTGLVTLGIPPHGAVYNEEHSLNGGVADVLTWSGEFHWPVRLDIDALAPRMMTPEAMGIVFSIDNLSLREWRIKPGASV